MVYPLCRPDLAPSDFCLFSSLKRCLDTYPESTNLPKAITEELNAIPIQEYQKTFQDSIQRMKLCIEHRGDNFEHLL